MGATTRESSPVGLTRDARHVYCWNDGHTVVTSHPSVTTVLRVVDRSGPLIGWAKRITAEAAVDHRHELAGWVEMAGREGAASLLTRAANTRRDRAGDIGTRVHQVVEQIARGAEPDVTEDEAPYAAAYRAFLAAFRPRFLAVEELVCSLRHGYGGQLDAIAAIGNEVWLLDVKTGSGIYPETALQLAAYANADFIGRPGIPRRFRLPRATRFGVIHLHPDGARLVEFQVDRGTFAAFLHARRLFAWLQGPGRSVVGAQVTAGAGSAAA